METSRLLAAGRDADIFEYGPGLVLKRSRRGQPLTHEARMIEYMLSKGYPVPRLEKLSGDGLELVMERIDGQDMVKAIASRPWAVSRCGGLLADLHIRLHEVEPPDWLAVSPAFSGDRIVHLDLHPLNVILGPGGPVVIDWANARKGDPAADVALAWALLAAGDVRVPRLVTPFALLARRVLLESFLRRFDREQIEEALPSVVAWKESDPNMSRTEVANMRSLVDGLALR